MTPAVFSALRGSHPHRYPPGFLFFLGALAMAIVAGCGSSGGCGSGSGYQVDGGPGLLSCGSTTGSSASAGETTDVTNPALVAQNTGFNSDAYASGIFYAMPGTAGSLPVAGTSATLTLTPATVHPRANPNDYTLTASAMGYALYCAIAGGGLVFHDPAYGAMIRTSATLRVNFPAFTGTGTFTINCVGVGTTGNTTGASLAVMVP